MQIMLSNIFRFYLFPLNRDFISIPICLIPKTNGNTNQSITNIFDCVITNQKNIGLNVIGEAFDGYPGWLSRTFTFAQDICDKILENPSLTLEEFVHHASQINKGLLIYEDMLHLVKCDRYRKSSGSLICPTLYESKPTISAESFEKNGISKWIINNCR